MPWRFLTQFADVFSELLERGAQAFVVGGDFNRVQHEGHTVDLLLQARPLPEAKSLRLIHRLNWAELREIRSSKTRVAAATVHKQQFRNQRQLIHQTVLQEKVSWPYHVSLGYMALNDRQDVMEAGSCHGAVPQTHDVTQHQAVRLLSTQAAEFVELQLGPATTVRAETSPGV